MQTCVKHTVLHPKRLRSVPSFGMAHAAKSLRHPTACSRVLNKFQSKSKQLPRYRADGRGQALAASDSMACRFLDCHWCRRQHCHMGESPCHSFASTRPTNHTLIHYSTSCCRIRTASLPTLCLNTSSPRKIVTSLQWALRTRRWLRSCTQRAGQCSRIASSPCCACDSSVHAHSVNRLCKRPRFSKRLAQNHVSARRASFPSRALKSRHAAQDSTHEYRKAGAAGRSRRQVFETLGSTDFDLLQREVRTLGTRVRQ